MPKKEGDTNMIGAYNGHYNYDKLFVEINTPDRTGIYYMGELNPNGSLGVMYVGRALGQNVTIKSRLLEHINNNEWPDVTHFGYLVCDNQTEIDNFEKIEIVKFHPKYNKRIG